MRVLIIGDTSAIGSYIATRLRQSHKVTTAGRRDNSEFFFALTTPLNQQS